MEGLVIARSGHRTEVLVRELGTVLLGVPRGKILKAGERIYAGDQVEVKLVDKETVAIETIKERRNLIPQPPIANAERLVIVMSWRQPPFSNKVLDGLLAQAEFFDIQPVVVLNKSDRMRRRDERNLRYWLDIYEGIGYRPLLTSAVTGCGLDRLEEAIRGYLAVFAGPSGTGKSSLLNLLIPGARLKTGEVSEKLERGRHVTTEVRLLPNPKGGWVADTPGFQKVDLPRWVATETLPYLFKEFRDYRCEYNNCLHRSEPNCGVRQALEEGRIARSRYESYLFWLQESLKQDEEV